ncbi:MAG: [FeFe] hydrogenase H-cluster radical SAM maturase HydE [Phycisphaerae bacterium]|jgi:biotin synthase
MFTETVQSVLNRLYAADSPERADVEYALGLRDRTQIAELFDFADKVRRRHAGNGILLRGIVEFSNECGNTCRYCGLNRFNKKLPRYTLTARQVIGCAEHIAKSGIKTVVLQSGESSMLDAEWLAGIIREIKNRFDMAVTLSVGEKSLAEYMLWKKAGADRYLLKIETTNPDLYEKLHPSMSFENRMQCSRNLRLLGYQNGSGSIIGLPGQTTADIAGDILFFAREKFDMLGIGPLIPNPATALANHPAGDIEMVLKTVAVTRIVTKNAHLPATTATGSVNGIDYRKQALAAGANVIMPNFTPLPWRKLYEIYPGKRCLTEQQGACDYLDETANMLGRKIDYSRGDSLMIKTSDRITA